MSTASARKLWAAKLEGRSRSLAPTPAVQTLRPTRFKGIVLGIDPSLRGTGVAVVQADGDEWKLLFSATLKQRRELELAQCLGNIHGEIAKIIQRFAPSHASLEQMIYVQNVRTALTMGASRGAAVSAIAIAGLGISEYPPARIKTCVANFGRASKEQVARQVQAILRLPAPLPSDESDAAAACICHILTAGRPTLG